MLYLDHMYVKFEYQGHWARPEMKMVILQPEHQFTLLVLVVHISIINIQ